jgi:competence protein ComEC
MKKDIKTNSRYSQKFKKLYATAKQRQHKDRFKKYNLKLRVLVALVLSICLAGTYFFKSQIEEFINFSPTVTYENGVYVHFIDVGQGKAVAIRTDDNKTFLIDCGQKSEDQKFFGYLEQYFFAEQNFSENTFDYFILSHTDSDHIGNSERLFANYEIKNCYRPKIFTPDEAEVLEIDDEKQIKDSVLFNEFVDAVGNENCGVMYNFAGEKIEGENYIFEFITPLEQSYSESNSYSPIIMFTYSNLGEEVKFLFTGDATEKGENEALSVSINELNANVLDVAHHGSNSSSIENFLSNVSAEFAVISVGENNSYNLPSQHVLERLVASGVESQKILRTDELGSVIFHVSENGNLDYFNQSIDLNFSNYSYWIIYANFQLAIIVVCFCVKIPPKREIV